MYISSASKLLPPFTRGNVLMANALSFDDSEGRQEGEIMFKWLFK